MSNVSIEGGTYKLSSENGVDTYVYRHTYKDVEAVTVFTATDVPKIGDSIQDGVHIPLEGYKINQDKRKWIDQSSPDIPATIR